MVVWAGKCAGFWRGDGDGYERESDHPGAADTRPRRRGRPGTTGSGRFIYRHHVDFGRGLYADVHGGLQRNGAGALGEARAADWPAVRAIYEEGLTTGVASFDIAAPAW